MGAPLQFHLIPTIACRPRARTARTHRTTQDIKDKEVRNQLVRKFYAAQACEPTSPVHRLLSASSSAVLL